MRNADEKIWQELAQGVWRRRGLGLNPSRSSYRFIAATLKKRYAADRSLLDIQERERCWRGRTPNVTADAPPPPESG